MANDNKPVSKAAKERVKQKKRPVKLKALECDLKKFHKPGTIFHATEQTAKALIKAKRAQKV